ncbi:MAG: DedA family protein [Actinomycetota bacterium]
MFGDLARIARRAVTAAGYPGIVGIMILENVFPPIPSEIVLPLAGYEVSVGNLNFVLSVIASTLGALIGALLLYAVGRYGGHPMIHRYGFILRVGEAEIERSRHWFDRFGDWVVLGARVIPLGRSIVSIPAGMADMRLPRFVVLTTIGSAVWNTLLIGAGYGLGERWEEVSRVVERYSTAAVVLLGAGVIAGASLLIKRRVRLQREERELADD